MRTYETQGRAIGVPDRAVGSVALSIALEGCYS